MLHTARTIAVVGLSGNEVSNFVGYAQRHGYRVIPVSPRETEILGETCYASLLDVPVPVDAETSSARRTPCRGSRGRRWRSTPLFRSSA